MKNEAASVEDKVWAAQTYRALNWQTVSPLLLLTAVSFAAGMLGAWAGLGEALGNNAVRNHLDPWGFLLENGLLHSRSLQSSWSGNDGGHLIPLLGMMALLSGAWGRWLNIPFWASLLIPQVVLGLGANFALDTAMFPAPLYTGLGFLPALLAAAGWALMSWRLIPKWGQHHEA